MIFWLIFFIAEAVKHSWDPNARVLNSKKLATKNAKTQSPAKVRVPYSYVCLVWRKPAKKHFNSGILSSWTPSRWTPWTTCSKDCIQSFEDPGVSERTRICLEDCQEVDPRLLIEQRPCYGNPEPTICTTGGILWSSFKQQWLTWKLLSRLQDLEHLSAADLCWEKFRRRDIGQETAERLYLRSDHGECSWKLSSLCRLFKWSCGWGSSCENA